MKTIALIPARGGSKRCPGKNIADLDGRPLIEWSIAVAKASDLFDIIAVTTEDPLIAMAACKADAKLLNRPLELGRDDTPMLPVVHDAVTQLGNPDGVVVLLQPTSPFRSVHDIDACLALWRKSKADAVVSVTEAPDDLVFEVGHAGRMRPSKNVVVPNGAVYVITTEALNRGHNWYSGITVAYKMPRDRSLDIDTPADLAMARAFVKFKNEKV